MSQTTVLVPIRSLHGGKSRLSDLFDPAQRSDLVLRMAHRLLDALAESTIADSVLVLSSDPHLHGHFDQPGVELVSSIPPGLNPAIDAGRHLALQRGADRLLVVFPDLPEVTSADLREIDRSAEPVTIVTDRRRDGTNALFLQGARTVANFDVRYGPGSFAAHHESALRLGLPVHELEVAGMATDLDTPDDWLSLNPETRRWLCQPADHVTIPGAAALALEHS